LGDAVLGRAGANENGQGRGRKAVSANTSASGRAQEILDSIGENARSSAGRSWGTITYLPIKTGIEWVLALVLLTALLPLIGVLALLVKLTSPGPALYRQRRVGKNGRIYWMYKLRSMAHDCERDSGIVWSTPGDPRVTSVGRWLRDTHLDELPQLFNIISGSMTLIGPRPERPEIVPHLQRRYPTYRKRLQVKPGLTGLAQMRLPADTELAAVRMKLAHDFYYVDHVSLLMDLRIAISTGMYFLAEVSRIWSRLAVRSEGEAISRLLEIAPIPEHDASDQDDIELPEPILTHSPRHASSSRRAQPAMTDAVLSS
jgi:lipopolysaccharide/colanic/teichoic acid biosynthesis glycosyltransferase